ncbi:MAG: efflux RND transporter periplasmic adaptor subunit [Chitinophagaceae bacterium]|nr:efflux RND transporter periplasmic adaptor subunit [Chitinophagaceae bacterium]
MNKYLLVLAGFVTVGFIACSEKKENKEGSKKFVLSDTMSKMIAIDSVSSCYIDDAISLSGEVSFNENNVNKVFPRSSGQVVECKVTLGDKVQAGQVLAVLKSADVAGNYADLSSANADINIAKRQMDNTEALYKNGIASEKEFTEAKQNYEKALSAKGKIQSIININSGNGSNAGGTYNLVSPISGYIVEKKVNTGNFIRADMGDNLFTISDLKNVWVNANVFEADIPKVKEGYRVQVTTLAYPDTKKLGTIDKISQVLDPANKTLRVRIKLENQDLLLRPAMFARVIVSNKENKKAICIPTKALISLNGKSFVVTYKSNSEMKIAEVTILKTSGDQTYLIDGVNPGEKLITQNQLLIFQQLLNQ